MKISAIVVLGLCCLWLMWCEKGDVVQQRFYCENYYNRAEWVPTAETEKLYVFENLKYLKTQCVSSKKYKSK